MPRTLGLPKTSRLTRAAEFRRVREEGAVLLNLDTSAYHGVNPVGSLIWGQLEEPVSFARLVEAVRARLQDPPPDLAGDVAAFIAGRFLGRHKLRPTLSPGKTLEGAMGGLVAVLAVAWGLRWLVPMFGPVHLAVVAALISVSGVVGDLAMSTIKRDLGIKDWSDALPGHGGILDRVNSLMLAAPVFFHYMRYVYL